MALDHVSLPSDFLEEDRRLRRCGKSESVCFRSSSSSEDGAYRRTTGLKQSSLIPAPTVVEDHPMGGFSFLKPSREDRRRKSMMQYSTARRNNLSSLSEMEDPDYEGVEEIARRMRVLLPNSWFRSTWDWVLIGLVMYNLINIPIEICFVYIAPPGVEAFNIVVDTLFIIDLLLNFRTAFYEGVALTPIIDLKQIARHYIFGPSGRSIGWFWPDLLAGIPFDWVPSRDLDTAAVLSFAKLGRIFRVGRLVKKLDKFTAARFVRVANVLIFILLTTNALACIWWRIGYDTPEFRGWQFRPHAAATLLQYNPMDADDELLVLPTGMLNKTRLYELFQTEVGMDKKYLTSLYWALTVVMKSPWLPPEMASEQVFSAIAIVASVMLFAGFVATLTATVNAFDKSHAAYRDKVALLRHFFQVRPQLSSDLKRKAFRYADAYFKQTIDGASEAAVLAHLPEHLRPTALLELNLDLIKSMPWLQETSFVCCTDFVSSLKPEILLRNDVLLKAGVISRNFYILTQGEVVVTFPPDGANLSSVGKALGFDAKTLAKVLSAAESFDARKSKRVNPGRFERPGSLIGWGPPHGSAKPLTYQAAGGRDSALLSLPRKRLAEIIDAHPHEAIIFMKASEHADKLINPDKRLGAGSAHKKLESDERKTTATAMAEDNERLDDSPMSKAARASLFGVQDEDNQETERKKNADEARSAGWLKAPASPAKPITTAPADSSALEGLTSDQKLALVLQEMVGLQRALADHTRVSNDLKRFLMEGSGMSA